MTMTNVFKTNRLRMSHYIENDRIVAEIRLPGSKIRMEDVELKGGDQGFCVKAKKNSRDIESCFYLGHRVDPATTKAELARGMVRLEIPLQKEDIHGWNIPLSISLPDS